MFYACVQRFDGMDEKILSEELNRALHELASLACLVHFSRAFFQRNILYE